MPLVRENINSESEWLIACQTLRVLDIDNTSTNDASVWAEDTHVHLVARIEAATSTGTPCLRMSLAAPWMPISEARVRHLLTNHKPL